MTLDPKALDPKALDAAVKIVASAMAQANGADPQGIDQDNLAGWELFATDARVALDRALPALLAAARREGAEAMQKKAAKMASDASTTNTRIHPDIPFNDMSKQAQTTMHMMAQFIAEEILSLPFPTEPMP